MATVPKREDRQTGVLSGIIGHELNNIAGALQGFTEIALRSAKANEPVREYLGEMRIAIGRIHALAHDLESLGEFDSVRETVPIRDCLLPAWTIEWQCSAATLVDIDPLHARRALEALGQIGRGERPRLAAEFCVTEDLPAAAQCANCAARIDAGNAEWVEVRVRNHSRIVNREALRDPFGSAQAGRMVRRLTLSALVHSAHCAGGHILVDETAGSLSVVFAEASRG